MVEETTKYELINQTGHAEAVHVTHDANQISLKESCFFISALSIQPTKINKEMMWGQYRLGVYCTDDKDLELINQVFDENWLEKYDQPLTVEKETLKNFIVAGDYHQDYLKKNPMATAISMSNQAAIRHRCQQISKTKVMMNRTRP